VADPDLHSAYRRAGVDYAVLDASKRRALDEALATSGWLAAAGARAVDESRGEPAFVLRFAGTTLAFVLETLGTKSVIAREYHEATGVNRFDAVAYDAVAAVLNDLVCVGALPLVLAAYFATGSSEWYEQADRSDALLAGWRKACDDAQCTWGGGESPSLTGLVVSEEIELAGSALGFVPPPGEPLLGGDLQPGDEIVLVASNGLHANGASLARRIAAGLPDGLLTRLPDGLGGVEKGEEASGGAESSGDAGAPAGQTFGEALLEPSFLYVALVRSLLADPEVRLTYLSHITGHGLLKLMRPRRDFVYRIHSLPPVSPVLAFLADRAELDAAAAHSTLNMGSGFAVYCRPGGGARVVECARGVGLHALVAGAVEEGPRGVVLEPLGVAFAGSQLSLGPDAPAAHS
jgi:phosphoribosylformylglycinamidine cyclo-ligase